MSATWGILAGAAAAACIAAFASYEWRWRALVARELPEELGFGVLRPEDRDALLSWKRYRTGWLAGRQERRAFRQIAGRLARVKANQRDTSGTRRKLLQVEVLALRTRLRRAQAGRAAMSD